MEGDFLGWVVEVFPREVMLVHPFNHVFEGVSWVGISAVGVDPDEDDVLVFEAVGGFAGGLV